MAKQINADPAGTVFVENASGGFNGILQRLGKVLPSAFQDGADDDLADAAWRSPEEP